MSMAAPVVDVDQLAEDIRAMVKHALRRRVLLPADLLALVDSAPLRLPQLRKLGPERDAFIRAARQLGELVPLAAVDLRAIEQRADRLEPQLRDAQSLLAFAAANGREIPDDIRDAVVECANDVAQGIPTAKVEAEFLKTYQALTTKLAPITAATLASSATRLPKLGLIFAKPEDFIRGFVGMTLGRFVHLAAFVLVLLASGLGLGYQTIGETALARHEALGKRLDELQDKTWQAQAAVRDKEVVLAEAVKNGPGSPQSRAAEEGVEQARQEQVKLKSLSDQLSAERRALPASLRRWLEQPCGASLGAWICFIPDKTGAKQSGDEAEVVFLAQNAVKRLNSILLPLLLGLLGAYSFVLRNISREIRERSFAPDSLLHSVVRLSLGSLAGVVAGWLLKPEQIGLLNSVPAWTLAFVAGYGTELVFAFLDRLIAAFTTKAA